MSNKQTYVTGQGGIANDEKKMQNRERRMQSLRLDLTPEQYAKDQKIRDKRRIMKANRNANIKKKRERQKRQPVDIPEGFFQFKICELDKYPEFSKVIEHCYMNPKYQEYAGNKLLSMDGKYYEREAHMINAFLFCVRIEGSNFKERRISRKREIFETDTERILSDDDDDIATVFTSMIDSFDFDKVLSEDAMKQAVKAFYDTCSPKQQEIIDDFLNCQTERLPFFASNKAMKGKYINTITKATGAKSVKDFL